MRETIKATTLNERYLLGEQLGRGGMGVVYQAHDSVLDREVAVKVLNQTGLGAEGRARLLSEAQAVAKLNHPNIVTVHDAGEIEPATGSPHATAGQAGQSAPYIVMELVEGKNLHEHPPDGFEGMIAMARDVSAALEHAHSHEIIHRDLKPENIIIAPDSTAKLMDFGLARSMATRVSVEGEIVGTVFYLAPEVAMGQDVDGSADLYSLGVILYELAAGELPFVHEDPLAVVSQHIHATVLPPRAKNPDIPPVLEELILRLLSKDPDDRPESAAALLKLLENPDLLDPEAETEKELSVIARIVRGRFVAREGELEQAKAVWGKALGNQGQTLLISGEPGIGKTRLVRELATHVEVSGGRALIGECYSEGGAPYAPFAQIVRSALRGSSQNGGEVPDFVMADLLALAPELRPYYPDVPQNPSLQPEAEQQRLFESVVSFCDGLAEHSPLMIVIDDAHWGDSGTLAMMRHLARRTRRQRVLLVATYREVELDVARPLHEVLLDINRARLATRLKLERLNQDQTRVLLAAIFEDEISPDFLDGIYRETEGNPFFIEEVCKALVEDGKLYYKDGEWHRPSMEELEIPQSVRVAIQTRVANLPEPYQDVLSMAAVLGREFEFEVLAAASDVDEDTVIDALEAAETVQLIEETGEADEDRFVFVHALIPVALLDSVRKLRRRKLHRRAATAIEELHPDDFEALALHSFEAGADERALEFFTKAGERAAAAYANAEAEDHFSAALDLVDDERERARLLGQFATVLSHQGQFDLAIEKWMEGIGLYQALGEQEIVARYFARAARAAWEAGDIPRGLDLGIQGLDSLKDAPKSQGLAELYHETGRAYYFNGQGDEAEPILTKALEMAETTDALDVRIETLVTLGTFQASETVENAAAGVVKLEEAVALAKANNFPYQESRAQNNLAVTETHVLGDLSRCRDRLLRSEELARLTGSVGIELFYAGAACFYALLQGDLIWVRERIPRLLESHDNLASAVTARFNVQSSRGMLLRQSGELDEALEHLRNLHLESREAGESNTIFTTAIQFSDAALETGTHIDEALEMIEAARQTTQFGGPVWTLAQQARLHAALGQLGEAQKVLELAWKRAGDPPFGLSRVWLGLAEAHLALIEGDQSRAADSYKQTAAAAAKVGLRWHRTHAVWRRAEAMLGEKSDTSDGLLELLDEAQTEFASLGAPIYADQVKLRIQELGGPSS